MSLHLGQQVWLRSVGSIRYRGTVEELEEIGSKPHVSVRVKWHDGITSWCMGYDLRTVSPLTLLAETLDS